MGKKNGAGGINLPDSDYITKLQSSVCNIQTVWYWHKNRNTDQWNKIESPGINPHTYGHHLIFDKGSKNVQWGKDSVFNKWCWENWTATYKRMKSEHFLTPYTKINSKRPKCEARNYKTLRRKHRTLSDINHSKILYDPPPRVMEIITKINKWNLIKLKSFCIAKETINKVKRQPSEWEKMTANETTDKELVSKI